MLSVDLGQTNLYKYLSKQLLCFFPDDIVFESEITSAAFDICLNRVANCFSHIALPGFSDTDGNTFLSHMHSDQYAMFLYYFMNSLWKIAGTHPICNKVMALNRMLHGFFVSYKCSLPDIFCLQHPVGTVLGNADYSNYLVVMQNVTVNTGENAQHTPCPKLGKGLYLGAGSAIIGNEPIGDRCSIGVNTVVYNKRMDDDCNAVNINGEGISIVRRKRETCKAQLFYRDII